MKKKKQLREQKEMTKAEKKTKDSFGTRPPVVVVLGHVDHGKTSILDYIRKTKVAEKESGGITQHIGAYQVKYQDKIITFIDTPGHEAFSAMRSRGAKVADIAVLVVAADEGVKPQTKEAISHIKKAGLATIVALNKIDRKEAQPEKTKKQLAQEGLLVESVGGQIPSVNLSAKTGQGIDELLEMILLVAEMEELKADFSQPVSGVVIESYQDSFQGPTATLLIQEGTLKLKDIILTESTYGSIKRMEDWQGNSTLEAKASSPVVIIGLQQVPQVGEKWKIVLDIGLAQEKSAKKSAQEKRKRIPAEILEISPDKKVLNLILKADVFGSLEAIRESLQAIKSEEVILRILKAEVGDISESDFKLAESAKAKIVGFRVKISPLCSQLAQQKQIKVLIFEVIYDLIQAVRELISALLEPETVRINLAKAKVIALFKTDRSGQIIGAKVLSGKVEKGCLIDVLRNDQKIGKGKISQLQHQKKDVENLGIDKEAGIMFRGDVKIEKGDILEFYREEKRKREIN